MASSADALIIAQAIKSAGGSVQSGEKAIGSNIVTGVKDQLLSIWQDVFSTRTVAIVLGLIFIIGGLFLLGTDELFVSVKKAGGINV